MISVEGLQETSALARRAHVMFVIGVGVISSLVSASIILFIVLNDILDSDVTLSTINDIGMPLSLILALSIILPYYYSIYRREKVLVSPVSRQHNFARKEVSIIIGAEHVGLVEMIEELLAKISYIELGLSSLKYNVISGNTHEGLRIVDDLAQVLLDFNEDLENESGTPE